MAGSKPLPWPVRGLGWELQWGQAGAPRGNKGQHPPRLGSHPAQACTKGVGGELARPGELSCLPPPQPITASVWTPG